MIYWQLFWEFFKTGLFAVGGGMATLPFLQSIALRYPWFTEAQLLDMIAVSESTPGPIGINMATYAGFQAGGLRGALVATLSLVLPSVMIILMISRVIQRFRQSPLVDDVFYGLRPTSVGLILGAMSEVFLASLFYPERFTEILSLSQVINFPAIALFLVLFVAIQKLPKVHPVLFILAGAVIGAIAQF